jgi:hypothetical protein
MVLTSGEAIGYRRKGSKTMSFSTCLLTLCLESVLAFQARPAAQRTYDWIAELVAADASAKTVTVRARIPEYISKYTDRFKPGDRVTLIWNMLPPPVPASASAGEKEAAKPSTGGKTEPPATPAPPPPVVLKTESDVLVAIDSSDGAKGARIASGFILPAEFVSADRKTVTVKLRVPDTALGALASIPSGSWVRATSPMSQPTDVAAISALTKTNPPASGTDTK